MSRLWLLLTLFMLTGCDSRQSYSGAVFGTSYSIQFDGDQRIDYNQGFDSIFNAINRSLSTYMPESDISRLNRNENQDLDHHFFNVFRASKRVYEATEGAFDPTIGHVVNAWDFGPGGVIVDLDARGWPK